MKHLFPPILRHARRHFFLFFLAIALCGSARAQTIDRQIVDDGRAGGGVGRFNSQAIVNGNPAISYFDGSNIDLKFARNSAADGSGTWTTSRVDGATSEAGRFSSLAVVAGNPAISYYDATNGDLKFVRALDADGTAWGAPLTVDSANNVGEDTSLEIVNGFPAISYRDVSNNDLKFVRALDAAGTAWGTPETLDSAGDTGIFTSLAIVNGKPAISYYDFDNSSLKFVRATDANGSVWGAPITLDSAEDVGGFNSLAVVNGKPAISYFRQSLGGQRDGDLKFVRATDADGSAWGTPETLDSAGDVGWYSSLAVVSGKPAISYQDAANGDLKFLRATAVDGSAWGAPMIVDSEGFVGQYTSLLVANGKPAISYHDITNGDLKWATFSLPGEPTVTTNPAANVTATAVVLRATANARGSETTIRFDIGTTRAYGQTATAGTINGTSDFNISSGIGGRTPRTTYHYRVVATSSAGTSVGLDETFTTSETPSLIVTTLSDESTRTDGETSLREAIAFANSNADTSTVEFADGLTGAILLKTVGNTANGPSALAVTTDVIIDGPGADVLAVRRDASVNSLRLFEVGGGGTADIRGLSLENGNIASGSGGAVLNQGTLLVSDCALTGNLASSGSGGIFTSGALTVERCFFSNNTASLGGAIYSQTSDFTGPDPTISTQIRNTTFASNTATTSGGALRNFNGLAVLDSCTIAGNTAPANAGGGVRSFNDSATRTRIGNSIIVGNLRTGGTDGTDVEADATNAYDSQGFNIVGDGGRAADFSQPTDTRGATVASAGLDATNGAVRPADNGGTMPSVALVANSIAIDRGNTTLSKDARNLARPVDLGGVANAAGGNGADIGAFEVQNATPVVTAVTFSGQEGVSFSGQLAATDADANDTLAFAITDGTLPSGLVLNTATGAISGTPTAPAGGTTITFTATDSRGTSSNAATATFNIAEAGSLLVDVATDDSTAFDGETSLREAIAFAGDNPDMSTVEFDRTLFATAQIITLEQGQLEIRTSLKIDGPGANLLAVSGDDASRVFYVSSGTVTFSGLTVRDGLEPFSFGGGVFNQGDLTVSNCTISGNRAEFGGGIFSGGGLTVLDSVVSGNSANNGSGRGLGGGICSSGNTRLTISGSTISGNDAATDAGGIRSDGDTSISDSTFSGNTSGTLGGGLLLSGTGVVSDCTISNNSARDGGGFVNFGTFTVSRSTISGNSSARDGGGVLNMGTLTLSSSTVSGNGGGNGGGVSNLNGPLTVVNSTVSGNTGTGNGGGIHSVEARLAILSCTVADNRVPTGTGKTGGGVFVENGNSTPMGTIANSIVANNTGGQIVSVRGSVITFTSGGNNLNSDADARLFNQPSDRIGVDPKLGTLQNNGGPTQTMALLATSPAINAGNSALVPADTTDDDSDRNVTEPIPFDGRGVGFARIQGVRVDIGAFETTNSAPVASPVASFTTPLNVEKTIALAGTDADGDTLSFVITSLPKTGPLFDGPDRSRPIRSVPHTLSDAAHRVTLVAMKVGADSFNFKVNDGALDSAGQTVSFTSIDANAPAIAFTSPVDKSIVNTLTPISGVASDNVGVSRVDLYVQRKSDNKYFNGTAWTPFNAVSSRLATTLTASQNAVTWTRASGLPTGPDLNNGLYALAARAFDAQGNGTSATALVNVDSVLPVVAISSPVDNAAINARPDIRGFASDAAGGSGIARVDLLLRRNSDGIYFDGNAFATRTPVFFSTTLSGNTWVRDGALPIVQTQTSSNKLLDGTYTITARATDRAGNAQRAISNFLVDTKKPLVSISNPATGSVVSSLSAIAGTSQDRVGGSGVVRVDVFLKRDSDGKYWNGSAWAPLSPATSPLATTLSGTNWSREGGLPSGANLSPGAYRIDARSTDRARNIEIAISSIRVVKASDASASAPSPVQLSSASAKSDGTIRLTFTGALGAGATDAANYQVTQNGANVEVLSVQQPGASEAVLTCDALTSDARVAVTYDLKDAQGRSITGTATISVK